MPYTHLNHILVRSCTNFLSAVYNSLQPGLCQINPALTLLLHPDAVASAGLLIGQRQTMARPPDKYAAPQKLLLPAAASKKYREFSAGTVSSVAVCQRNGRRRLLRHLILQRQLILQLFISVPQKIFKRLPVRLFTGGNYRITEKQSRRASAVPIRLPEPQPETVCSRQRRNSPPDVLRRNSPEE